jgi:hypothetical protein
MHVSHRDIEIVIVFSAETYDSGFKFSIMETSSSPPPFSFGLPIDCPLETVLAALMRRFKFSLTDKEIGWQMLGITTPYIDSDIRRPKMPLFVAPL